MKYEKYFKKCQDAFTGKKPLDNNSLFIKNLGCEIFHPEKENKNFKFYEGYINDVKNIFDNVDYKIKNQIGLFDSDHQNIIKVDKWEDCEAVRKVGLFCAKIAEENVYGSNSIVESVLIYKNLLGGPKRSSWLWHYDDNVSHQIKIMIYLNEVKEKSGAMQVLKKIDGTSTKFLSSKISPTETDKSKQIFGTSRLPSDFVKSQKVKTITGKAGTFIIFDPNTPHRATLASTEPTRCCIVFNLRPYHKDIKESKIQAEVTKTWSSLGNVKKFSTLID